MSVMSLFDDKLPATGVILRHLSMTSCFCKATKVLHPVSFDLTHFHVNNESSSTELRGLMCYVLRTLSYDELFL